MKMNIWRNIYERGEGMAIGLEVEVESGSVVSPLCRVVAYCSNYYYTFGFTFVLLIEVDILYLLLLCQLFTIQGKGLVAPELTTCSTARICVVIN